MLLDYYQQHACNCCGTCDQVRNGHEVSKFVRAETTMKHRVTKWFTHLLQSDRAIETCIKHAILHQSTWTLVPPRCSCMAIGTIILQLNWCT